MKVLTEEIIKSLTNEPEKWSLRQYTIEHESGLSLWATHQYHLAVFRPMEAKLGWWEKKKLWKAIQIFKEVKLITLLKKKEK